MKRPIRPRLRSAIFGFAVIAVLGCDRTAAVQSAKSQQELVVFAAASLKESFSALEKVFETTHPQVDVTLHFAGSQELRTQLQQGAIADVLATADQKHMRELESANLVVLPEIFARNELAIVVSPQSAKKITTIHELPQAERIVLGAPEVPIGRYTLDLLDRASVALGPDFRSRIESKVLSRELNVRQVLAKVKLGEADAGIVYRTDAKTTPELVIVAIPREWNVIAEYPIARVKNSQADKVARAWLELIRSTRGQQILQEFGFLPPT